MNSIRYAVVSGAGKGIGRAISKALAADGYTVIACARTLTDLESLQAEAVTIIPHVADLSTQNGVDSLVQMVQHTCGTPNVLVNNLGVFAVDTLLDTNTNLMESQLQANFWSSYRLTLPFVKPMVNRGNGHIINICSIASIEAVQWASTYTISKHAQLGFSRALQNDLKDKNVFVTAILPGNVDTPSWDGYTGDRSQFLQPEEIANLVMQEIALQRSNEIVVRKDL